MTDPLPTAARAAERVLLAIDGSPASDIAVDLVGGLAWPTGTALRVVHAVDLGPGLFGGPWPSLALTQLDELETALQAEGRRELESARDRLVGEGRVVTTALLEGRPASTIVDEAATFGADLVVLGSRGHGAIATMLLGSVSAEVITHAHAPVLVARRAGIRSILFAWDGSGSAELAARAIETWPVLAGIPVRVVSVADVGLPWWTGFAEAGAPALGEPAAVLLETADAARAAADALAAVMVDRLRVDRPEAIADRREGDAAHGILTAANEHDVDLIVMGTHGRTGLARLALGSVAANVIRHAECSVLVVRGPSKERVDQPA